MQTVRHLQALNYWGKTSDQMDAYVGDDKTGVIFIDPNTTPLWSPSIPDRFPTMDWAEGAAKEATPTTPA